jgi:hypothetical protein
LTTLFETLINIIHSQFMFSDEQSQITFTCQIANIATTLIDLGIENWTPDAIRSTTSGLKIKPLNMYYKQSRHVGLMFLHDDFDCNETNIELLEQLKTLEAEVAQDENIHFDKVIQLKHTCEALLYQNDWFTRDKAEQTYLNDISYLIEQQQDIYGIDKPEVRNLKTIIRNEDQLLYTYKDPISKTEKLYTIRRCNNQFYNEQSNTTNLTKGCFKCMKSDHYTSDHNSNTRRIIRTEPISIFTKEKKTDEIIQRGRSQRSFKIFPIPGSDTTIRVAQENPHTTTPYETTFNRSYNMEIDDENEETFHFKCQICGESGHIKKQCTTMVTKHGITEVTRDEKRDAIRRLLHRTRLNANKNEDAKRNKEQI